MSATNSAPNTPTPSKPVDRGEVAMHFLDYWRVLILRWPLILLVFLLVVGTTGVVTYLMPRYYASKATLQIHMPGERGLTPVFGGSQGRIPPYYLMTQFEILRSRSVLEAVVKTYNLQQKWGEPTPDRAYAKLSRMMDTREVRGTDMISIIVFSTDPEEAALLANGIAMEYRIQRVNFRTRREEEALNQLKEDLVRQKKRVDEFSAELANMRMELDIIDLAPDSDAAPDFDNTQVVTLESSVNAERMRVASIRTQHEEIAKMDDDQLIRSLPMLNLPDPTLIQLYNQLRESENDEAILKNRGYGASHPQMETVRLRKATLYKQLQSQVAMLRKSLTSNLEMAEASLRSLEERLEEARKAFHANKIRTAPYYEKKTEYIRIRAIYNATKTKIETVEAETREDIPITVWEKAEPSSTPARPNVMLNMGIACIFGLLFGCALAFFIEYLDTSVKRMEEIEAILNVPLLAVIPQSISILLDDSDDNPDAEGYRIMRTNIEFNRKSPDANTLTIVSAGPGEGKSLTLNNLAVVFARGGYTTLIVDADFRRPSQHRIFGIQNNTGLSDYLTHETPIEELVRPTKEMNLFLMTSGRLPTDAVGLLNSQRMLDLVDVVKSRFDVVFFDSPPILGVSDASVICSAVDLTMIVVQHRRYPRSVLQRVKQSITNVGGNIVGVVLNNVDIRQDADYGYYTSYYNYYYHKAARDGKNRASTEGTNKMSDSHQVASTQESNNNEEY